MREAVFAAAGGRFAPRAIIDLGGGSLEISFLRGRKVERALALPLGTVRLMEMFDQAGSFTPESFARLRRYILSMLRSHGRAVSARGTRRGGRVRRQCRGAGAAGAGPARGRFQYPEPAATWRSACGEFWGWASKNGWKLWACVATARR